MADELQLEHTATGRTIYVTIENSVPQIWNGSALVTRVVANWATYKVAQTETPAGGYLYLADFPAGITTPDAYTITFREQVGGDAVITDPKLVAKILLWDGKEEISLASNVDSTATETISILKALELIYAHLSGKTVKADGHTDFYAPDDSTALLRVTHDLAGTRSEGGQLL
ncbi:MAG TPA: hypothetical protein VMW52_03980 [Phycisphaerae bacterium]|nr:hypothetical protein [Phycisphaerae bacterium]